jgi:outer membrane receptor protein involved in Fe transport
MKRLTYLLIIGVVLLSLGSGNAFGQATASGTIQGTVTDKSQASVQGAQVVAKNKGTELTRTTTTSEAGYYRFELLPIGTYVVTITKTGFATVAETIEILIGQTTMVNAELKTGSVSEIVEVTSETPLMDTLKTDVSQSITPREVEELPLLGRDVANLAYLAPGVKAADSYDPTKNRYAILSVNGQGGRNVNVTINGVDNKDNTVGGPVMQLPLEAVQEFVISTQRFSAANGKSEGAAINMITKSGSNALHGSAFASFRDKAFNSINHFEEAGTGQKSPYSRQVFGGSFGAPIIKDKVFGFFAVERQREHTSLTETNTAFDELSLVTSLGAQPASVIPTPFFESRYNFRFDYHINQKHSAYISYSSQANNSNNDQSDGLGDLTGGNFTKNHLQVANMTLNSVLSNTLVNSFTWGYQFWNNIIDSTQRVPYVTFNNVSEWFGTNVNVPQESYQRKFQFRDDITKTLGRHTLKGGVDYIYNPKLGGFFKSNSTLEIDFLDDPSVILSNPSKCGSTKDQPCYPQGFATPGAVVGMSASSGNPYFDMPGGTKQLGLYFQDDWKITNRLTVNLGVRWDKDYNLVGASAIAKSRTFEELTAINSPFAKLPHDDNKDFSPRIGFAYDLTGHGTHIVRGGYGLYYGNVFQNIPLFMIQQANSTIYQGLFSITGNGPGQSCSDCDVPGTGIPLSNWSFGNSPLPVIPPDSGTLAAGATGRLMDPNYRNPVSEQFNLGYQWALTSSSVVEVEYVHELGLHENKTININPTIATGIATDPATGKQSVIATRPLHDAFLAAHVPVLGRVMDEQSVNRSRYDGFNFSYRQRMTKRFSVNANYTLSWARGWDVNANGSSFRNYPHDPLNPWDPADFGYTPNDERHHLTVSGFVSFPLGIQVAPILQFGTARPYDLTSSFDVLARGSGYTRPVIVPNDDPTNFNAIGSAVAAFQCLQAASCHQVGYDTVRGDNFFQLDVRFSKNIHFKERFNVQLFFQAFNMTNRANFGNNFFNTPNSTSFEQPAGFINPSSTSTPRSFNGEFGFRFSF